jgi:predicted PurR-regulated permease PerM
MFDFLERLQKKPAHKRRIFAASLSLGVTAIIFAIWLSVILPTSIHDEVANSNNGWTKNIVTPIGAFKRNTAQAFDALKGQLGGIKEALKANTAVYNAEPGAEVGASTTVKKEEKTGDSVVY